MIKIQKPSSKKTLQKTKQLRRNKFISLNRASLSNKYTGFPKVQATPRYNATIGTDSAVVNGSERLFDVYATSYGQSVSWSLNPATWNETRVKDLASTWQLFHYNKLLVDYIPIAPTTQGGEVDIAMMQDGDIKITPRSLSGASGGVTTQPYQHVTTSMPPAIQAVHNFKTDNTDTTCPKLHVLATIPGVTSPTLVGYIFVTYNLTLTGRMSKAVNLSQETIPLSEIGELDANSHIVTSTVSLKNDVVARNYLKSVKQDNFFLADLFQTGARLLTKVVDGGALKFISDSVEAIFQPKSLVGYRSLVSSSNDVGDDITLDAVVEHGSSEDAPIEPRTFPDAYGNDNWTVVQGGNTIRTLLVNSKGAVLFIQEGSSTTSQMATGDFKDPVTGATVIDGSFLLTWLCNTSVIGGVYAKLSSASRDYSSFLAYLQQKGFTFPNQIDPDDETIDGYVPAPIGSEKFKITLSGGSPTNAIGVGWYLCRTGNPHTSLNMPTGTNAVFYSNASAATTQLCTPIFTPDFPPFVPSSPTLGSSLLTFIMKDTSTYYPLDDEDIESE